MSTPRSFRQHERRTHAGNCVGGTTKDETVVPWVLPYDWGNPLSSDSSWGYSMNVASVAMLDC